MSDQPAPRVLVFDSGVGGLSVASCIVEELPGIELVYLADNLGFPYGDKPESVVVERCLSLIAAVLETVPCDVIVVACNTASTVVLPHLRAMTDVPVVGVVPAIKPAAAKTENGRIGVLATPATIRRPYLDSLVNEFAAHCQVERIGHSGLVRWAEDLVRGVPVPMEALAASVAGFRRVDVDTVVLGCTHYPLLGAALREVLPGVHHWVDSGQAIARRVAYWLTELGGIERALAPEQGIPWPVRCALFSGPAPEGVAGFMAGLGLPARSILANWPSRDGRVRSVGLA
ncbi:glutamate racemase [Marinobacter salinisoli]|uniref:Glutamate racemase n=1 Tax=Marinobacter salinisoli TaxID=2769486 RepID=A0ABX7MVC4_9GAMM|nr:glutamate racemase [Marinobacter salinisoli]QSP96325.1 glutamate racemase [Marinobacter salinisoli]